MGRRCMPDRRAAAACEADQRAGSEYARGLGSPVAVYRDRRTWTPELIRGDADEMEDNKVKKHIEG